MEFDDKVEELRDVIARVQLPTGSSKYEHLLKAASIARDWNMLESVEKLLGVARLELQFSQQPKLKLRKREEVEGEISIGVLAQDPTIPVKLKLEDISRGIAIVGPTGSGKTTVIILIMRQLLDFHDAEHPNGIPFLIVEFKQDYRHLKDPRIRVIRWEWLRLALFKPPRDVDPKIFAGVLADLFTHVFGILYASENVLIQALHSLFEKYSWKDYPTFKEVLELIESSPVSAPREAEYKAVILNRLATLKLTLGSVIDCKRGMSIEDDILPYPTIIELDGCPRDSAHFLAAYFIAYIVCYRIYNNMRGSLESVIVFDEATRLYFDRSYSFVDKELGASFLETAPQYVRDYKLGLIFGLQQPSIASRSLWANTNTKLVAALSEGDDIGKVVEALNLTQEYEQEALSKIPRGTWLMKKPGLDAFLLRTDDYQLVKDVTTEQLQQRMKPVLDSIVPKETTKLSVEQKLRELTVPELTQDAYDLIRDIGSHPILGITGHAKSLKISIRRMEKAKAELEERKLILEKEVSFGTFRPAKFLVPTALGLRLLQDLGMNTSMVKHILTEGVGFEHVVYQVLLMYAYRSLGYRATLEHRVGDRRVDVWVEGFGERIAVEVELTTVGTVSEKLGILGEVEKMVLVFKDKLAVEESKKMIKEKFLEKVGKIEFKQIGKFLEELRSRKGGGTNATKA